MTERNTWDIDRLKESRLENTRRIAILEDKMQKHDVFKETTIQQMLVVFEKIKELQEGDKWIKRMFITALTGTGLSALSAVLFWFINN